MTLIRKACQMREETREGIRGGQGSAGLVHFLEEDDMMGKCRLAATITLPPGSSIGEHPHDPDTEIYLILSGTATVLDNGDTVTMTRGDAMFTGNGGTHAIANASPTEPLVFLAVVIR